MEALPQELMFLIFDYLSLNDLLEKKLVNKRWEFMIENLKIKELIIKELETEIKFSKRSNCWHFSYKPISLNRTVFIDFEERSLENFVKSKLFLNTFSHLKNLKLSLLEFTSPDLSFLNDLTLLEHLEINNPIYLKKRETLKLPNLRIFQVSRVDNCRIEILSTNLEVLFCYEIDKMIINAVTVKYLELEFERNNCLNFKRFPNLEIFKINNIQFLNLDHFDQFPEKLREFHVDFTDRNTAFSDHLERKIRMLYLVRVMGQPNKNVKMFYKGIHLNDSLINNYQLNRERFRLSFENYDRLDKQLPWYIGMEYGAWQFTSRKTLPDDFFCKFMNLQIITVNGITNKKSEEFLDFLKNCPSLNKLEIWFSSLDQKFYDRLVDQCNLIQEFKLVEYDKCIIELDYRFIFKLKLLKNFDTDQFVNIETLNELKNLKFLLRWIFKINEFSLGEISCKNKNLFSLKNGTRKYNDLDFDELINLCKKLGKRKSHKFKRLKK